MKKSIFLLLLLSSFWVVNAYSQPIPLVYEVENTGANCPKPVLPAFDKLPVIQPLTDPFAWSSGKGRSTKFADWPCRRAEIAAEIQQYEIGEKPARPDSISASFADTMLTVRITKNGNTLVLTAKVTLPPGAGPFPAIIGVGRGTGSLPANLFTDRGIATIAFNFTQVMAHTQTRGNEPINKLYPELTYIGAYSAWSWGVSRLIDGLELVQQDLKIDLKHLGITGCSFAGKMALFAGAFDERIALTIAQEPGGGGAAAWRVSETLGNVETLGRTSHAWFIEEMFQFAGAVPKLPHDHHELMAMVAPRALLILGNPDYEWLADESGYVSARAAHEVWKTFGVADRFGFSIVAGHNHCMLPPSQYPEVEAFIDKFLLGNTSVNTNVQKHPFDQVNYKRWFEWWGTGKPTLPELPIDKSNVESAYFEAECANVGSDWQIVKDKAASNGAYATVKSGLNSAPSAPASTSGAITISFSIKKDTTFYIFGRVNCASSDGDSFWVKLDDGAYTMANGLNTKGWKWLAFTNAKLKAGAHTLTIAYRENGALLDKIAITSFRYGPEKLGDKKALNRCKPNQK
ncbi:MAG: hypothetical protein ACK4TA_24325 [Saprospiraceae bacterium]